MKPFSTLFRGIQLLYTVLTIAGCVALCFLGVWQLRRHGERQVLNATIVAGMARAPLPLRVAPANPEPLAYQPVLVRGRYDGANQVLLRNREFRGITGFHVLTPLVLADGKAVLIDRGWLPQNATTDGQLAAFAPPVGEVTVAGVVRVPILTSGPAEPPLAAGTSRRVAWFRADTTAIGAQSGHTLWPLVIQIQPQPGTPEQLPQPAVIEELGIGSHLGYALQWFAFAGILAAGYALVVLRTPAPALPARRSS